MNLYTIGFSKKSAEEFFTILKKNEIVRLIDIRLNNRSQLAGFTNVKHLPYFLKVHNMNYLYKPIFAPTKELLNNYKNKQKSWQEYELEYYKILIERKASQAIDLFLLDKAVLLCSEASADQCHRRLLAEFFAEQDNTIKIHHL